MKKTKPIEYYIEKANDNGWELLVKLITRRVNKLIKPVYIKNKTNLKNEVYDDGLIDSQYEVMKVLAKLKI